MQESYVFADVGERMARHIRHRLEAGAYGSIAEVVPFCKQLTTDLGNGRIERVVQVDEPPVAVGADLEEALLEDMTSDLPGMSRGDLDGEVYIPDSWPFFYAVFSDESGNVLVQPSEPLPAAGAERQLDFFAAGGLRLFRLQVAVDDIEAVRNGFLYARRYDHKMSIAQLVRYRIRNWHMIAEAAQPPITCGETARRYRSSGGVIA